MTGQDALEVAAELRALRAEILRHEWTPVYDDGHILLPRRHYRIARKLRTAIDSRARLRRATGARIARQRRIALWMTIFAAIRTSLWILAMAILIIHWAGGRSPFLDSFTTPIAALYSADSHAAASAAHAAVTADFSWLESDIGRLAELQPGPEAAELARGIARRVATATRPGGDRA